MAVFIWMVLSGVLVVLGVCALAPPAPSHRVKIVLLGLALVPVASALRPGVVYGPLDTNVGRLPWGSPAGTGYVSKGGALNDVTLQFVPWQAEARRQLLAGRLPQLNPYSGAGAALLGNGQAAPFSLISLLSLPIEPVRAQILRAFLKTLIALLGTFLVARQLGSSSSFSLLAAVAYAYGGSLTVWRLFPHAEVMAFVPLAFLAIERLLERPAAWRARLLLFGSTCAILLAGHPETAAMAGFMLLARIISMLNSSRRGVVVAVVTLGLAVGATAFFTLPLAEAIRSSEKLGQQGGGRDPGLGTGGPWWGSLANLAAPGIFGTPQRSAENGPAPLQWLAEGTTGLLCLCFAIGGIAAFGARNPGERFLTGLTITAFALHLNALGAPSRLFALPLLSAFSIRYVAYLGSFGVAILAAVCLTRWCAEQEVGARSVASLLGAALGGVALAAASRWIVDRYWQVSGIRPHLSTAVVGEELFHWHVALLVGVGALVCLGLRRTPLVMGAAAIAVTMVQLLLGLNGYTPTVEARYAYPPAPAITRLTQEKGLFRIVGTRGVFVPNNSTYYRIADIRTHDPTESVRYVDWLVDLLNLDRSTYKKQYRRPSPSHEPFLRLLGVRYLLAGPDLALGPPWIDCGLFGQARLWELAGEVRWAFFPKRVIAVGSAAAARDIIRHDHDPYARASLELAPAGPEQPNGDAMVTSVGSTGDHLEISVAVRRAAWLVVSQSAIPGWNAVGEHGSLETSVADGALLAVRVPAGTQRVRLQYLPPSFLIGLVCSIMSVIGFALLFAAPRRHSPRAQAG